MLQPAHFGQVPGSPTPDGAEEGGLGEVVSFAIGFLLRHWMPISIAALLASCVGLLYIAVTPPVYSARSKVIIRTDKAQFVQQQAMFTDGPMDNAEIESQLQVLQSKELASKVVENLKLVDDSEFMDSASRVGTDTSGGPTQAAVASLLRHLSVERVGNSYAIEIGFSARTPEQAALVANAVAKAYIADQADAKIQANRTASTWLQERLGQLREQSTAADRAVIAFEQANNIVSADGKRMDEQSVADLNRRLVAARAQTSDLQAQLGRIESLGTAGDPSKPDSTVLDTASSEGPQSPILTGLRQQYLELAVKEAEYAARYGTTHLAVVNLRNRMQELRRAMAGEIRNEYDVAKQRQTEIEKQLQGSVSQTESTNKAAVTLRELQSAATTYHSLYDSFLQRYTEQVQQETFPLAEARLISLATPPTSRDKPKPALVVLALALMGGVAAGGGIGALRDLMDRAFRTSAQVQSQLHLPCIAMVPLLSNATMPQLEKIQVPRRIPSQRMIVRDSNPFWKVVEAPTSRYAEAIRSIKLAISLSMTDRQNKVVGFTSSLPNEGKSTVAASIAHLTAQSGSRTVLVDCDLRNPSLSRSLAPHATAGIGEIIYGGRALEELIWRDPVTNLFFLPASEGALPLPSSVLIEADATKKLFDRLRGSFDFVIVDLPPLAPVIDTRSAAHLVDSMVLVIEWGVTKVDVIQETLNAAPNVRETLIGAVLNKTDMKRIGQYDTHRASLYNNKYYARYGYSDAA